jgi:hypothetical protein
VREELERDQGGTAAGGAVVVEPAGEELDLLPEAELSDRAVGDRALAVVAAARRALDLVLPFAPQVRELSLLALPREGVGLRGCLLESQLARSPSSDRGAGPTYRADGRNRRPVRFCSRMWADQPATREQANIAGAIGGGISATSRTTAE